MGKIAYDYARDFASDDIEVVAFSESFLAQERSNLISSDWFTVAWSLLICTLFVAAYVQSVFLGLVNMISAFFSVFITVVI